MKKIQNYLLVVTIGFLFIASSCVSPKGEQKTEASAETDTIITSEQLEYILPSPGEVLSIIHDLGLEFKMELINPLKTASEFALFRNQALNFGCYLTDFSYLLLFDRQPESIKYLYQIQEMSTLLGIEHYFDNNFFNSIISNLNEPDTLKELALDQSALFLNRMEQIGNKDLTLLITTGAMVEVIYLTVETIQDDYINDNTIEVITNLAIFYDTFLLHYSLSSPSNGSIQKITTDLQEIRNVFTSMSIKQTSNAIRKEGKLVISSEVKHNINDYNLSKLKILVKQVRSNIVNQKY